MIYLLDICQDPGSLKIILFIKELINIIFIVVPIGLIVFIAIDMFKNTVNTESEDKKNLAKSIKRLIFCALLFLVPTIVNATVDLVQQVIGEIPYVSCWSNATKEKVESLAITQAEEKLKIAKDKKTLEAITEAQTAVEQITDESKKSQYQKEVDELNKELKQKLEEEKQEKKTKELIVKT